MNELITYAIVGSRTGTKLHMAYNTGGAWCGATKRGGYRVWVTATDAEIEASGKSVREHLIEKLQARFPKTTLHLCDKCF